MRFLQQFSELLDDADEKTTSTDLQSLTRDVASTSLQAAGKSFGGSALDKVKGFDLGISSGFKELTSQIGADLKDFQSQATGGSSPKASSPKLASELGAGIAASPGSAEHNSPASASNAPAPGSPGAASPGASVAPEQSEAAQRLADLRERLEELEAREAERLDARLQTQARFEELDAQLQALKAAPVEAEQSLFRIAAAEADDANKLKEASAAEQAEHQVRMNAMRREFVEHQKAADTRAAALQADIAAAQTASESLGVELTFWHEKVQSMLRAKGLDKVPEALHADAKLASAGKEVPVAASAAAAAAARRNPSVPYV